MTSDVGEKWKVDHDMRLTIATSFHAEKSDAQVFGEGKEHPRCVAPSTHAGDDCIGKLASEFLHLLLGFIAYDGLEGADDGRERVGTDGGSDDVVRRLKLDDPCTHCLW